MSLGLRWHPSSLASSKRLRTNDTTKVSSWSVRMQANRRCFCNKCPQENIDSYASISVQSRYCECIMRLHFKMCAWNTIDNNVNFIHAIHTTKLSCLHELVQKGSNPLRVAQITRCTYNRVIAELRQPGNIEISRQRPVGTCREEREEEYRKDSRAAGRSRAYRVVCDVSLMMRSRRKHAKYGPADIIQQ